jgi:O-antigen/teichoic acid export membrane protein
MLSRHIRTRGRGTGRITVGARATPAPAGPPATMRPPVEAVSEVASASWMKRGTLAVIEQGLFGGSGFVLNILLARWLEPAQYGTFVVAYTVFLLISAVHAAVLSEPMVVFGAGKYASQFPRYFRIILWGHWGLAAIASALLATTAGGLWLWGSRDLAGALAGLAIAAPFILLLWLSRRAGYVRARLGAVVGASALYFLATTALVALLESTGLLSPFLGVVSMGAGAVAAGVLLLWEVRSTAEALSGPSLSMVVSDHWSYGSWSVLATAVSWCSGQVLMLLIPAILGFPAAAAAAAVVNLYRPLNTLLQSGSNLILPDLARLCRGSALKGRDVARHTAPFVFAVVTYALLVSLVARPLLHHVYGGRYDDYLVLVWLFGLSYVVSSVVQVLSWVLKASGHPRSVVWAWAVSAAAVIVLAVPVLRWGGLPLGVTLICLSYLLAAVAAAYQIRALRIWSTPA